VPERFVKASLSRRLDTRSDIAPGYGYQWWITQIDDAPHGPLAVPTAIGNGGQRIFLLSELRTVVVVTAGDYDAAGQGTGPRLVLGAVLAAAAPAPAD
jgi:hypothetical protein